MFKGTRIVIVLVVLVLGLISIFGAQYFIKTYRFEEPFKEKVLAIEGIDQVNLIDTEDGKRIVLTLGNAVVLDEAFLKVEELAHQSLKGKIKIEIEDQASPTMKDLYHEMHFAIYEGITTGYFTQMVKRINEIGAENQVQDLDIKIDQNYVYLKLVKNGEMYSKIVTRNLGNLSYIGDQGGEF
ncbi:MAG: hypothetical protein KAX49_01990 [Halanaerobiales bacterium]|nr:hypothetical protein [Halanaerobiales bacterium]